ncbi:uncharacterized protein EAF01_011921 [Botrytis porri]|uniref:uncharacterized protein n=1 Tax=Botrytis porri TaxID=87229 RepID=UPI0019029022|nr:uncharacterized protein EAF01_011921 [Botrytis porri]KAF7880756.1 hypothetical protein EAF01_011921 [Botrytis porri]
MLIVLDNYINANKNPSLLRLHEDFDFSCVAEGCRGVVPSPSHHLQQGLRPSSIVHQHHQQAFLSDQLKGRELGPSIDWSSLNQVIEPARCLDRQVRRQSIGRSKACEKP